MKLKGVSTRIQVTLAWDLSMAGIGYHRFATVFLRLWAADVRVYRKRQSCLEFRLQDASHISQQIMNLLNDLHLTLNEIMDELSDNRIEASSHGSTSDLEPEASSQSELEQLHNGVAIIVDRQYQLSALVRNPAPKNFLFGSNGSNMAAFEPYDIDHVCNIYANAHSILTQRLGRAITRRKKYLNYRERRHAIEKIQTIEKGGNR